MNYYNNIRVILLLSTYLFLHLLILIKIIYDISCINITDNPSTDLDHTILDNNQLISNADL